jgi:hypothetical protein
VELVVIPGATVMRKPCADARVTLDLDHAVWDSVALIQVGAGLL